MFVGELSLKFFVMQHEPSQVVKICCLKKKCVHQTPGKCIEKKIRSQILGAFTMTVFHDFGAALFTIANLLSLLNFLSNYGVIATALYLVVKSATGLVQVLALLVVSSLSPFLSLSRFSLRYC